MFDVKADGKRKGRLIARGDMNPEPEEAVYSSVATLRSLHTIILLAELNGLTLMQGDIRNAYFVSYTQEKFTLLLDPNLDTRLGTASSLIRHCMVYIPVVSIFMKNCLVFYVVLDLSIPMSILMYGSMMEVRVWEYIIVYVDDIIAAMKDPHAFFDKLQGPEVGFKMKGIGAPTYHLGTDFFCDDDRTLCLGAQTYSKRLVANFE